MANFKITDEERNTILAMHESFKNGMGLISEQERENPNLIPGQMKKIKPDPGCDYMFNTNRTNFGYNDFLYKVKSGDTLDTIANANKPLTVNDIKKMNPKIKGTTLKAGCVILISKPA